MCGSCPVSSTASTTTDPGCRTISRRTSMFPGSITRSEVTQNTGPRYISLEDNTCAACACDFFFFFADFLLAIPTIYLRDVIAPRCCRGAMNSLMAELLEGHIRSHELD